jgi:hypothetical protein
MAGAKRKRTKAQQREHLRTLNTGRCRRYRENKQERERIAEDERIERLAMGDIEIEIEDNTCDPVR